MFGIDGIDLSVVGFLYVLLFKLRFTTFGIGILLVRLLFAFGFCFLAIK